MTKVKFPNIKIDFPLLSRTMNGHPLVYLDNAASTQKPDEVINAIARFYQESNANIHRGVYSLSEEATELFENTRKRVAKFIHSATSHNVIFTRGTTESINMVAHSWARKFLKEGDEILLTEMEHHSNIVPWYLLAKERGVASKSVRVNADGTLDLEDYRKKLTEKVKLVTVMAMSNALGTINPVKEMGKLAHDNGSLFLIDGAQSVPHMPTNVEDLNCDFLAFSGHKMLGPTGVGVLWVKPEVLDTMDPFLGGGEMINKVTLENITWAEAPHKFEAGTMNFADVAAFSHAMDYLDKTGMKAIHEHEMELVQYALKKLSALPDITVYGPKKADIHGGAISFNHNIVHAHDVGTILSEQGVAIRAGHHCAQPLMKVLGTPATARASFYFYNTEEDVDALIQALGKVNEVFGLTGKTLSKNGNKTHLSSPL